MESHRKFMAVIVAFCSLVAACISGGTESKELRPSEHGLEYQTSPKTGVKSPEMLSFFGGKSSPASVDPLPRAMNSSAAQWMWPPNHGGGSGGGRESRDHLRDALLVASLVCGITGVALLVASAAIYFVRFQKQRSSPSSSSADNLATREDNHLNINSKV